MTKEAIRDRKQTGEKVKRHALMAVPQGTKNERRFDLWKKLKDGQLSPDVAARVSQDYAKDFAPFEARCDHPITINGKCKYCGKETPSICN